MQILQNSFEIPLTRLSSSKQNKGLQLEELNSELQSATLQRNYIIGKSLDIDSLEGADSLEFKLDQLDSVISREQLSQSRLEGELLEHCKEMVN